MWLRKDYEDAGESIGKEFVEMASEESINKLASCPDQLR